MTAAAYLAAVLLVAQAGFQLALAAGAPWGRAAYGGVWPGVLPKGIRINSLVFGVLIYPLLILYVLHVGEVATFDWLPAPDVVIWVMVVFFGLGMLANAFSRSKVERLWAPFTLILTICTLVLALG